MLFYVYTFFRLKNLLLFLIKTHYYLQLYCTTNLLLDVHVSQWASPLHTFLSLANCILQTCSLLRLVPPLQGPPPDSAPMLPFVSLYIAFNYTSDRTRLKISKTQPTDFSQLFIAIPLFAHRHNKYFVKKLILEILILFFLKLTQVYNCYYATQFFILQYTK